jgi:mRNA degradation ribonuclease J1/J2
LSADEKRHELNEIDRKGRQEAERYIWDKYVRTGVMREADVRAVFDVVFAEVDHYIARTIALHRAGAISDEELKKIINTVKGFLKEMGSPVE